MSGSVSILLERGRVLPETKYFLAKAAAFSISIGPLFFIGHELIYEAHHYCRTRHDPDAIYVIGDSRTYHSVDVTTLRRITGRSVYSSAQPAMSAYSVVKLAEMVPPGATVLFGPGWGMVLRDRTDASFRSGFSLRGILLLWQGAGEYWHFRRILVVNRIPSDAPFFRDTPPLEDSSERDLGKLEKVRSFYLRPRPAYADSNLRMLSEAIRILLEKGCRLEVIRVPIPDDVAAVEDRTYGSIIEELDALDHPNVCIHADIQLDRDGSNLWFDADHMNAHGRRLMTAHLLENVLIPDASARVER